MKCLGENETFAEKDTMRGRKNEIYRRII